MDNFGEIEQTVVCEYNARSSVPLPVTLADGSTVNLASLTVDLSNGPASVLLQGVVNWSAAFTIPPSVEFGENGFAEATFQFLRDGQVIYQVTQTIRQKDFEVSSESQTNTSFDIASMVYFDAFPLTNPAEVITYTLQAADIALFPQTSAFTDAGQPIASAAVGSVTLFAQEVGSCKDGVPAESAEEPVTHGVKRIIVDQSIAPLPATIPLTTPLPEGEMVELARIDVGADCEKDGILLTVVANWGIRVTSNNEIVSISSSGSANVTFELLRNETVIYRITQTAVQTFLNKSEGPVETATFEIADIRYLDFSTRAIKPGSNTYFLRVANITIIEPVISNGASVLTTASVGPVTFVAEVIDGDKVKKKSKHRPKRRR